MNAPALFKGLTIPYSPTLEQVQALNAAARRRYFFWSMLVSLVSGIAGGLILWIVEGVWASGRATGTPLRCSCSCS